MNTEKDFKNYFVNHLGKGSLQLDYYNQRIEGSLTMDTFNVLDM